MVRPGPARGALTPTSSDEDGFTPEQQELVQGLARAVVERRLAAPALLLLDGLRPMNFVVSQLLAFFSPIVGIVSDRSKIDKFQELLEKRESIPYIWRSIHQLEEARRG